MRRSILFCGLAFVLSLIESGSNPGIAAAQLLMSPQRNTGAAQKFDFVPAFSFTSTEYEVDNGGNVDIDRTILGASAAYGLNPTLDMYGEIGYVVKAEPDDRGDGDGLLLGGGFKGLLYQKNGLMLHGFAGVRYVDESYEEGNDGNVFEVPLGVVLRGKLNREAGLYGGIDVFPYSDGEIDNGSGGNLDIERDNPVGLRLGADYRIDTMVFDAEFALISDTGFTVRMTLPL